MSGDPEENKAAATLASNDMRQMQMRMDQMMQQMSLMQQVMAANNMPIPQSLNAGSTPDVSTEAHNFSQILQSSNTPTQSNADKSKDSEPANMSGDLSPLSLTNSAAMATFTISDFSPEWDYTTGGSKVMICVSPPLTHVYGYADREALYEVSFGDNVVPVHFIQAGVLKCNAPPHPHPGFVPLTLLRGGETIQTAQAS